MKQVRIAAGVAVLAVVLAGCAATGEGSCPTGLKPMISAELYFGRSMPAGGQVSEAD